MAYDPKATTPPQRRVLAPSRRLPAGTVLLLDLEATDIAEVVDGVLHELQCEMHFEEEYLEELTHSLQEHADAGPDVVDHRVAVIHETLELDGPMVTVLVRVAQPLELEDADHEHVCFVWVLASDHATHPHVAAAAEFLQLMHEESFATRAKAARTPEELNGAYSVALDEEIHFEHHISPELRRTGRLFGGLVEDVKRRAVHYKSDFTDGLTSKSLASSLFIFFAVLAPSVAFGGLLSLMTEGSIGVVETLIGTAIGGIAYALFAGQPLTIIGSTGPIVIFLGILYPLCQSLGLPYLPTMAWVGWWTSAFLLLLLAVEKVSWIRYFTRFTDDTFAALISIIFIWEAIKDLGKVNTDPEIANETALLSMILALGTYIVATQLSGFRQSPYLQRSVREFFADFGPAIAIFVMTGVGWFYHDVALETLAVPDNVRPTADRAWMVNPFETPTWAIFGAAIPAAFGTILVYLDQNITVRLVNSPDNKLKKGAGYNQDMTVVAALIAVCSLFGLPWLVAATVRSLNHVRSLADIDDNGKVEQVVETRVTGIAVHLLMAGSLLLLPFLQMIPMSVLFGLFLYMGIASTVGNQFFERLRLWVMEPERYPPTYYLRAVPARAVHSYTMVQAVCLAVLWIVKASPLGILFPVFIALLVPVRMLLERFFEREHLALLDAEEEPEQEDMSLLD